MKKIKKNTVLKTGIWIKEQQGQLTIGSLDKDSPEIMIVPDQLSSKIFEFEKDMMDALYGDSRIKFNPSALNIEKLLSNLKKQFKEYDIRISFSGTPKNIFHGDYNEIYGLIEKFVQSSLNPISGPPPVIYINISVLQDHLCIIYRDSLSVSDPANLATEFNFIKSTLNGEINHKTTPGNTSYYDIIIPSKHY
ncbi:MAG: hypothetical protein A2328_11970 [Bdellovibrionales bacterium RIFOXYB2_FULL_36_6]|nr:MAG: hypothetical protein A2328_11970 [Bdellovibrionales bacterium RIFOXYB2_FULL_36_6]